MLGGTVHVDILKYLELSREERRAHLDLDSPCVEIGGNSTMCRAMLAHIHNTTIGDGRKCHVCHACHNDACTNPGHLYWGTPRDNWLDSVENGTHASVKSRCIAKYGLEGYSEMQRRNGRHNSGRTPSNKACPEMIDTRMADYEEDVLNDKPWGRRTRLGEMWGVSRVQAKRFIKKYRGETE